MFEPAPAPRRRPMLAVSAAAHAVLAAVLVVPPLLATPEAPELDGVVHIAHVPCSRVMPRRGRPWFFLERVMGAGRRGRRCARRTPPRTVRPRLTQPAGVSELLPAPTGEEPLLPFEEAGERSEPSRPGSGGEGGAAQGRPGRLRGMQRDLRDGSRRHAARRRRDDLAGLSRARAARAPRGRRRPRGDHRGRRLGPRRARAPERACAPGPGGARGRPAVAVQPRHDRRAARRGVSQRRRHVLAALRSGRSPVIPCTPADGDPDRREDPEGVHAPGGGLRRPGRARGREGPRLRGVVAARRPCRSTVAAGGLLHGARRGRGDPPRARRRNPPRPLERLSPPRGPRRVGRRLLPRVHVRVPRLELRPGRPPPRDAGIRRRRGLPPRGREAAVLPGRHVDRARLRPPRSGRAGPRVDARRARAPPGEPRARLDAARLPPRLDARLQLEGLRRQLPRGLPHSRRPPGAHEGARLRGVPDGDVPQPLPPDRADPAPGGRRAPGARRATTRSTGGSGRT